jgi:hypothetical protein
MPLQSTNDRSTQNSRGPSPASDTSEDKRPDEKLNYGKLLEVCRLEIVDWRVLILTDIR